MKTRLLDIFRRENLRIDLETHKSISAQTRPVAWKEISSEAWEKIHYLCFHDDCLLKYPSCRLSLDGSWMTVLGSAANTPDLNTVLAKCHNNLTFLRIDRRLTDLLDVTHMERLRFLHIEESYIPVRGNVKIIGLEKLTELQTLHLEGTFDFDVLDVGRMNRLERLTIRDNQKLTGITGLASLHELEKLNLFRVDNLMMLEFSGLRKLLELELWNMKKLRTLTGLNQLSSLGKLQLREVWNEKSVIDLSGLERLEWVDLSDNKSLRKIRGLEDLNALKYFDISETAITRIPDVLRDKPLETLALSGLELDTLSDWLPDLGLPFSVKRRDRGIRLFRTKVRDVNMDIFKQPREEILRWFASQREKNRKTPKRSWDRIEDSHRDLLDAIIWGCKKLQENHRYWKWDEDGRSKKVQETLEIKGYIVYDQTQQGWGGGQKSAGELDLKICSKDGSMETICEALIVNGCLNTWDAHLDKLLTNYNPHGYPVLYLLTYVDCGQGKFGEIWRKYQKKIEGYNPKSFELIPESVRMDLFMKYDSTRVAMCRYRNGSYTPTVYHIFARMGAPD